LWSDVGVSQGAGCGCTDDDEYIKTKKKTVIHINFKNNYFDVRSNIIKEKV